MTAPDDALAQARAAVASMREQGAYLDGTTAAAPPVPAERRLFQAALIDPDLKDVRSTRRFGPPITALKRGLLRLLDQYHRELIAEQTRFNVAAAERLQQLEQRIETLEREIQRGR